MTIKSKIIWTGLIGLVLAIGVGYFMYNKPHKDMLRAKAIYELSSQQLFSEFEADEASANEKYLGKVLQVNGTIQDVQQEDGDNKIILEGDGMMFGVICNLDELTEGHRRDFTVGESVQLKCECTGLLMDVVMKRCVEVPAS